MRLLMFLLTLVFVAGCAPAGGASTAIGGNSSTAPAAPKILTIGIRAEPTVLNTFYSGGSGGANGVSSVWDILNNYLMAQDESYAWIPQLATDAISTEKGSWRLNSDGTMDTVWRIRPNVRWQDGQPFTSGDLLFSYQVYRDPEIPNEIGLPIKLMESASIVDPLTFAIHWTQLYVQADRAPGLIPLPRHILEPLSNTDKANFSSSLYFQTEFVGLGPYRLTEWERGAHLNLSRHDGYFLGRPPLDTVTIRILENTESLVAHHLGGSVDVAAAVDIDSAVGVRSRWEAEGNIFISQPSTKFRVLEFQARPEFARPTNGVTNPMVRQALYHAIDRPPLAEAAS
ncbi:MAG TPA: ABC transporter substrate-binding protein, partial [Chloroflexota bacterium]